MIDAIEANKRSQENLEKIQKENAEKFKEEYANLIRCISGYIERAIEQGEFYCSFITPYMPYDHFFLLTKFIKSK